MKKHILYILPLLGALLMAGCSDDNILPELPDTPDGGDGICTIQVTVESFTGSRDSDNNDVLPDAKVVWRYGDKLILKQVVDGAVVSYTFTLQNPPSGKSNGDVWEGSAGEQHPTFKHMYMYSTDIPNLENFTGTVEYRSYYHNVYNVEQDYGYTATAFNSWKSSAMKKVSACPYMRQTENNSTEHLKNLDMLSAKLQGVNLKAQPVISLRRNYTILKIVLDDIYYSVYGGSMLFVRSGNGPNSIKRGMILGENKLLPDTIPEVRDYYSLDEIKDYNILKGKHYPFFDVSGCEKDDFDHAVRDDQHKLVAYMVLPGECKISEGERITVALRDQWSFDWYFWKSEPLRAITLHNGSVFTLDFTKKTDSEYVYHSTFAINSSQTNTSHYAATNLGAQHPLDAGDYYMFGYDTPIRPEGFYPNGNIHTPFYYYKEYEDNNGKHYDLGFNHVNGSGTGTTISASYTFLDGTTTPKAFASSTLIGSSTSDKVKIKSSTAKTPKEWWREWIKALTELPMPFIDKDMYQWAPLAYHLNYVKGKTTYKNLDNAIVDKTVIKEDGNPIGIKVRFVRTGHSMVIPATGILEPLAEDNTLAINDSYQTVAGAVAQIPQATKKYAMMGGYSFYMIEEEGVKKVKATGYYFDLANEEGEVQVGYYDLYTALPVRPYFSESIVYMAEEASGVTVK